MRVIQFSDSFLPVMDGVGNVVYQYATNMGQKGQEVYVVCPQTDTGYRGNYPFEIVDYLGVPLLKLKSYKVGTALLGVHCLNRLNHIHPDIIHVHSPFIAGHAGLSYAHRAGCPIVGTFHSKYYDDFLQVTGNRLMAGWGAKLVANLYEKFTEVWTVSASSADTLRGYGYKGDIRVISNGTDIRPVTDADVDAVRARFGLDDTPLLLYVGQINWKKNLRCVLEGCARLKRPFRLALAGQGPHEREVARLAEALGIGDKVLFTGHIGDGVTLNALYRAASLFLFPSLYDTSGLVVREAAAMGTPSVVVAGSSASEGMRNGFNGYLCRDDSADLARVVEQALADPGRLSRIGDTARDTIPIPWATLVDEVMRNYERIVEKQGV